MIAELGKDIVFIPPSAIPGQHRPDIFMDGVEWEIKCPEGNSKRTIENNMRKALLQPRNVIFDLRHIQLSEFDPLLDSGGPRTFFLCLKFEDRSFFLPKSDSGPMLHF